MKNIGSRRQSTVESNTSVILAHVYNTVLSLEHSLFKSFNTIVKKIHKYCMLLSEKIVLDIEINLCFDASRRN